jgi:hypothetical protein
MNDESVPDDAVVLLAAAGGLDLIDDLHHPAFALRRSGRIVALQLLNGPAVDTNALGVEGNALGRLVVDAPGADLAPREVAPLRHWNLGVSRRLGGVQELHSAGGHGALGGTVGAEPRARQGWPNALLPGGMS